MLTQKRQRFGGEYGQIFISECLSRTRPRFHWLREPLLQLLVLLLGFPQRLPADGRPVHIEAHLCQEYLAAHHGQGFHPGRHSSCRILMYVVQPNAHTTLMFVLPTCFHSLMPSRSMGWRSNVARHAAMQPLTQETWLMLRTIRPLQSR
ncbi:hypothetical protein M440DRAFT_1107687 [Trichoderma longibrachiatum ATCC 18648]|uniref:Uncharacterized protein n=1 Tax=Trichoderma longibrachiatum ATCC 18648 TaxID=983965 RepID=A0A2T4CEI3_TRILO|nr:hypothetical protein M440DRAFT_1107687 [Trichoderma longibrachiatum ATCC 18648]